MKLMNPQPAYETVKIQQLENTDSFECLGITNYKYEFLCVVHRPIGSKSVPTYKNGKWYWTKESGVICKDFSQQKN